MKMKKHEVLRILADHISPYLYSVEGPPKPLNDLFLNWIDAGVVPTKWEVLEAVEEVSLARTRL